MRDISIIDAAFLYFIANAGESEALWLAQLSENRGYGQLKKRGATAEQITDSVDREAQAIRSAQRLVPEARRNAVAQTLDAAVERLRSFGDSQQSRLAPAGTPALKENPEAARIIVRRKRFGTLPLDDLSQDRWEGYPSGAWAAIPTIALYWCDGKRNLAEVIRLTQLELGPSDFDFVGYFRFLQRHGYVEFG